MSKIVQAARGVVFEEDVVLLKGLLKSGWESRLYMHIVPYFDKPDSGNVIILSEDPEGPLNKKPNKIFWTDDMPEELDLVFVLKSTGNLLKDIMNFDQVGISDLKADKKLLEDFEFESVKLLDYPEFMKRNCVIIQEPLIDYE